MRTMSSQLIRFIFVGAFAMLIDAAIFMLILRYSSFNSTMALFFSWTAGFLANFSSCDYFVFQSTLIPLWQAAVRHYVTSLISFALQAGGMLVMINHFEVQNVLSARISIAAIVFFVNFFVIRRFVFLIR